MTRPATLPELLAQGKVKPGDYVECVDCQPGWVPWEKGQRYQIGGNSRIFISGLSESYPGTHATFRPVKPAKAEKWGEWQAAKGGEPLAYQLRDETGMQVKRTKDGSLMIRYRRKG